MAAAACIGVAELRELLAEAVAALQWAIPEGREAGPVEVPVSDEIGRELQERVALVATMAALPEDLRGKARTVFEREETGTDQSDREITLVVREDNLARLRQPYGCRSIRLVEQPDGRYGLQIERDFLQHGPPRGDELGLQYGPLSEGTEMRP